MTQIVHTNDMVAHLWAHQSQERARSNNGNLYFEGSTIYSYGEHFPIARHVNGVVLFTTRSYSITTSQHISRVRQACSHLPVFHVAHVADRYSRDLGPKGHRENFDDYKRRFELALTQAVRARTNTAWRLREAEELMNEANRYNQIFKLRRKSLEMPDNLDHIRERAKKLAAQQAAKKKADIAKRRKLMAEAAEKWRLGESVSIWGHPDTLLRISGDEIQTSAGARFPVDHGRKAFAIIKRCHDKGECYQRNGHSIHLGTFSIDRIEQTGDVRAGCHFVKWGEIARVAKQLDLI